MTQIVHTNVLLKQRGEALRLPPRRRRLSTIVKQHGPVGRRAVPLVFRAGDDPWQMADRAALDRASRMRDDYRTTLVGPRDTVVFMWLVAGGAGSPSGLGKATQIASALSAIALLAIAGPLAAPLTAALGSAGVFAIQAGLPIAADALRVQTGDQP